MPFALRGFLIGFAIAAPVGPIGILCIRRTIAEGRSVGFLSGLGAATADMSYGLVAAFGLTAVENFLVSQQVWLHYVGGVFLVFLGIRTLLAKPSRSAEERKSRPGMLSAYLSTLGLTLTNPATVLSFTAIFAGLRLGETDGSYLSAASLVVGVFLGSATWWLTLSAIVGFFRERFTERWMTWVNRFAGVVILAFGAAAILVR
jgi:threonine/homoserine/homoserine lactone efflux protein